MFILNKHMHGTVKAVVDRFLNLNTEAAGLFYWQGREITIETTPERQCGRMGSTSAARRSPSASCRARCRL
jgi:hypothetical protein